MAENNNIIIKVEQPNVLNFDFLEKEGLKYIQQLGTDFWTDFNSHDPGVTVNQLLAYAITDLGNRASLNIKSIVFDELDASTTQSFHTAAQILSNRAITINDFRKLIIDIRGVKNVWFELVKEIDGLNEIAFKPVFDVDHVELATTLASDTDKVNLKGLYYVYVELNDDETLRQLNRLSGDVEADVEALLQANRDLCEDYSKVEFLTKKQFFGFDIDVDIKDGADITLTTAKIQDVLTEFLSPSVQFNTLTELLNEGIDTNDIFVGPSLHHGFVKNEELKRTERKTQIFASDIIQELMNIPEVNEVNRFRIKTNTPVDNLEVDFDTLPSVDVIKDNWKVPVSGTDRKLVFSEINSKIRIFKGFDLLNNYPAGPIEEAEKEKVKNALIGLRTERGDGKQNYDTYDLEFPLGEQTDLLSYAPIQNELPAIYGTGLTGLPASATQQDINKARQLKAYLMFFEQILGNYFAQLSKVKDLLSWKDLSTEAHTVYAQLVQGIKDVNTIVDGTLTVEQIQDMLETEEQYLEQRNILLNHLVARFNEDFTRYSTVLISSALMHNNNSVNTDDWEGLTTLNDIQAKLISDKIFYLTNAPYLSGERAKAYTHLPVLPAWTDYDVTGYQKRVYALLGFGEASREFLNKDDAGTTNDKEGFHVLENILLRVMPSGTQDQPVNTPTNTSFLDINVSDLDSLIDCPFDADPYSFRVTIVLPGEAIKFKDFQFRKLTIDTLREQLPAHIALQEYWLDSEDLQEFEDLYRTWLQARTKENLNNLIDGINLLKTRDIYAASYNVVDAKNEDAYDKYETLASVVDPVDSVLTATIINGTLPEGTFLIENESQKDDCEDAFDDYIGAPNNLGFQNALLALIPNLVLNPNVTTNPFTGAGVGDIIVLNSIKDDLLPYDATEDIIGTNDEGTSKPLSIGDKKIFAIWEGPTTNTTRKDNLVIRTTNASGGINDNVLAINLLNDRKPTYIMHFRSHYLTTGFVIAELDSDLDGAVVAAEFVTAQNQVPAWLGIVASGTGAGNLIKTASPHPTVQGVIEGGSGLSAKYPVTVKTTDDSGGVSIINLVIEILPEEEAKYQTQLLCGDANAVSLSYLDNYIHTTGNPFVYASLMNGYSDRFTGYDFISATVSSSQGNANFSTVLNWGYGTAYGIPITNMALLEYHYGITIATANEDGHVKGDILITDAEKFNANLMIDIKVRIHNSNGDSTIVTQRINFSKGAQRNYKLDGIFNLKTISQFKYGSGIPYVAASAGTSTTVSALQPGQRVAHVEFKDNFYDTHINSAVVVNPLTDLPDPSYLPSFLEISSNGDIKVKANIEDVKLKNPSSLVGDYEFDVQLTDCEGYSTIHHIRIQVKADAALVLKQPITKAVDLYSVNSTMIQVLDPDANIMTASFQSAYPDGVAVRVTTSGYLEMYMVDVAKAVSSFLYGSFKYGGSITFSTTNQYGTQKTIAVSLVGIGVSNGGFAFVPATIPSNFFETGEHDLGTITSNYPISKSESIVLTGSYFYNGNTFRNFISGVGTSGWSQDGADQVEAANNAGSISGTNVPIATVTVHASTKKVTITWHDLFADNRTGSDTDYAVNFWGVQFVWGSTTVNINTGRIERRRRVQLLQEKNAIVEIFKPFLKDTVGIQAAVSIRVNLTSQQLTNFANQL